MASEPLSRQGIRDGYTEHHDGDEPAECIGQWCCGCAEHPIGKPWGWARERWNEHYRQHHPSLMDIDLGDDDWSKR